jgi:hypothetical protein
MFLTLFDVYKSYTISHKKQNICQMAFRRTGKPDDQAVAIPERLLNTGTEYLSTARLMLRYSLGRKSLYSTGAY